MCSDISTPNEQRTRRRRSPWRAIGVLLLVLATIVYGYVIFLRVQTRVNDDKEDTAQVTAGFLAEDIEAASVESGVSPAADPTMLANVMTPYFAEEPLLASVRIWSRTQELACEISRPETATPRAGNGGLLPDLGFAAIADKITTQQQDSAWMDEVGQYQLLENEESDLGKQIDAAQKQAKIDEAQRQTLYQLQQTIIELARTRNDADGTLDDTIQDMTGVLNDLADKEANLNTASDDVETVSTDLTEVFTDFRASTDRLATLPPELASSAPASTEWFMRVWPAVRGQRVIIPLFISSFDGQLATPAGFAEVVLYDRPGEVLGSAGWQQLTKREITPAAVMLLLALLIIIWPRRKEHPVKPAPAPTAAE